MSDTPSPRGTDEKYRIDLRPGRVGKNELEVAIIHAGGSAAMILGHYPEFFANKLADLMRDMIAAAPSSEVTQVPARHGGEEDTDAGLLLAAVQIIEAHHITQFGTDRVDAIKRAAAKSDERSAALEEAALVIVGQLEGMWSGPGLAQTNQGIVGRNEARAAAIKAIRALAVQPEINRLRTALEKIALLDEADGHELKERHAFQAVAIACETLGKHPSEILHAAGEKYMPPRTLKDVEAVIAIRVLEEYGMTEEAERLKNKIRLSKTLSEENKK